MENRRFRVLCVDDNSLVADGVRVKLEADGRFAWVGHLHSADRLIESVRRLAANIVLLDIDMPGRAAMDALEEVSREVPEVRTIILSGYSREEFLDRAVECGAWGYVAKGDGPGQVIAALDRVANGQFAFGPSVLRTMTASS